MSTRLRLQSALNSATRPSSTKRIERAEIPAYFQPRTISGKLLRDRFGCWSTQPPIPLASKCEGTCIPVIANKFQDPFGITFIFLDRAATSDEQGQLLNKGS